MRHPRTPMRPTGAVPTSHPGLTSELPTGRCAAAGRGRLGAFSVPSVPESVLVSPRRSPVLAGSPEQPGWMLGQIVIYIVLQARVCWQEEEEEEEEGAHGISRGEGVLLRVL